MPGIAGDCCSEAFEYIQSDRSHSLCQHAFSQPLVIYRYMVFYSDHNKVLDTSIAVVGGYRSVVGGGSGGRAVPVRLLQ